MEDMELLQYHKTQNNVPYTFSAFTGNITVAFVYNRLTNNRQEIIFIYNLINTMWLHFSTERSSNK
jgi:hypothetical protein